MRLEGPKMSSITICSLLIVSLAAMTQQQSSGTPPPGIPNYLLDCYWNRTLFERDLRIPSTISSLIAIVQKLENGAASSMDMRALSTTILRQFRVDGIVRDPDVTSAPGIIPFGQTGFQSYRLRALFDLLLPSTGNVIPNGTLTQQEKCSLHFMLSDSIEVWDRGDSCGTLSTVNSRRRPRSAGQEAAGATEAGHNDTRHEVSSPAGKEGGAEKAVPPKKSEEVAGAKDAIKVGSIPKEVHLSAKPEGERKENNTNKTTGEVEKLPHTDTKEMPVAPMSGKLVHNPQSGPLLTNYPRSDCPVENGVIYTPAGAVSAGIMVSGIACGLQSQSVSISRLKNSMGRGQSSRGYSSGGLTAKGGIPTSSNGMLSNTWMATLAGDLAEVAIYQGPLQTNQDMRIGAAGGWNDTTTPHWYFLKTKNQLEMTDAEIRGGLDGLILGKNINDWNSALQQSLRLSQVLDMYYSNRGISGSQGYRACQRKDHSGDVAKIEDLKSQTMEAARVLLLYQQQVTIFDSALQLFSDKAAQMFTSYLPSGLIDVPCEQQQTTNQPLFPPSVELVIVLDTTWNFDDAKTIIGYLTTKLNLNTYGEGNGVGGGGGSTLTIISGKDGTVVPIVNDSSTILDFYSNFTHDSYMALPSGLDMVKMLTKLRYMYANSMQRDHRRQITSGRPQAVVFIPSMTFVMSDSDRSSALNLVNRIRIKAPDTRLLFLTPTSKDTFSDFVIDKDKDVFQVNTSPDYATAIDPLITRLSQSPRRIINSACTYKWESDGGSGSSVQYADPVVGALFFRILPNYFFKSDKTTIVFRGMGDGTLNVCYSRKPILNGSGTNSTSSSSSSSTPKCTSITSDTAEFSENQPCSGSSLIKSCDPMYFSVTATSTSNRCTAGTCRYPDMVRFTVTHTGLTCGSGAKGLLTSGFSISLLIFLFSSREAMNRFLSSV